MVTSIITSQLMYQTTEFILLYINEAYSAYSLACWSTLKSCWCQQWRDFEHGLNCLEISGSSRCFIGSCLWCGSQSGPPCKLVAEQRGGSSLISFSPSILSLCFLRLGGNGYSGNGNGYSIMLQLFRASLLNAFAFEGLFVTTWGGNETEQWVIWPRLFAIWMIWGSRRMTLCVNWKNWSAF